MVAVPTINTPEVQPENVPQQRQDIQTSPEMFGAGVGRSVQQFGQEGVGQVFKEVSGIAEHTATLDGMNAVNKTYDWASEQWGEYKKLQGAAAAQALPGFLDNMRQHTQDTADELSPVARQHYLSGVDLRMFYMRRGAEDYADQQAKAGIKKAYFDTLKDTAQTYAQDPFGSTTDPATGATVSNAYVGAQQIEKTVKEQAAREGLSPGDPEVQNRFDLAMHDYDVKIAKSGVAGNPRAALTQLKEGGLPYLTEDERSHFMSAAQKNGDVIHTSQGGQVLNNKAYTTSEVMKLVDLKATQYGVPVDVARAVAIQESGGSVGKVGDNGQAIGTMQLHAGAAKDTGVDRNNPEQNIEGGMKYLAQNYKQFGNWDSAIAAYNAGPGALKAAGGDITKLPPERQQYVASVNALRRLDPQTLLNKAEGNPMGQLQIAQNLTALTPAADDAKTIDKLVGPARSVMEQANYVKRSMLQYDPVGYLGSHNQSLPGLEQSALKDPTHNLPYLAKTVDNMYDSLGQDSMNRPLFSQNTVDMFSSKIAEQGTDGGIKAIMELKNQSGIYWPRVAHQLANSSIPPQVMVGSEIPDQRYQQSFARAYEMQDANGKPTTEKKDFSKLLPKYATVNTDIDTRLSIDKNWSDFTASMARSNVPDSSIAAYQDGVKRLAMQLTLEQGGSHSGDKAAQAAIKAFTDQYKFTSDGQARIPKESYDAVMRNADDEIKNLQVKDLAVSKAVPDASYQNSYLQGVKNGSWITNSDGTGLVRLGSDNMPVRKADGSLLSVPFTWPAAGHAHEHKKPVEVERNFSTEEGDYL